MFNKPEVLLDGFGYLSATELEIIKRNLKFIIKQEDNYGK